MKALNTISALAMIAIVATSCLQNNEYEPQIAEAAKTLTISASVKSNSTKSDDASVKSEWNANESITVVSTTTGAESRFLSVNSGSVVEFAATSKFDASSVAAVYPFIKGVAQGTSFSFNGQDGTIESANKFSVLTAKGTVANDIARLSFEHKTSLLALSNIVLDGIHEDAKVSKIVLNGVPESANVVMNNNEIQVSASENGSITVYNDLSSEVFISFLAGTASSIEVAVYDTLGGQFFFTLNNGSSFAAGLVYTISGETFQGGYPISFNPSTEDWNN